MVVGRTNLSMLSASKSFLICLDRLLVVDSAASISMALMIGGWSFRVECFHPVVV